jgi:CubicO group peptidase (beta-lactamase class C family)
MPGCRVEKKVITKDRSAIDKTLAVEFDEKKVDAIFANIDQGGLPGGAVGIAIGGRPIYRKGFGLANMELPVILSPTIRMRIGSITKHFTALAYLLLCEDAKAGIDDPIGKHLPELHPVTQNVTMRQLMGNISGLRDALDICWTFSGPGRRLSTNQIVSIYRFISDANALPGTVRIYNNGGWQLLTVAIERICGRSLEDVLRERVFEPLGMFQSTLRRNDHSFLSNSATCHMTNPAGQFEKREEANLFSTDTAGEGGIVSSVDDMLLWLANMDEHRVGSTQAWQVMRQSQLLANGTLSSYGLGLVNGRYRGVDVLYHPGGGTGSNAQMLKVPAAGLDVVCMVNRHDVTSYTLVDQILDSCLPGLEPAKRAPNSLRLSGIYVSPTSGRLLQFNNDATAYWIKEVQERDDRYIVAVDGTDFQYALNEDGVLRTIGMMASYGPQEITIVGDFMSPASVRFNDFGEIDELLPVKPSKSSNASAIVGRYRCATADVDATISDFQGGARLQTVGRFGTAMYPLECLGDGIWQAASPIMTHRRGILSFNEQNVGFRFSNLLTRSLPFQRQS